MRFGADKALFFNGIAHKIDFKRKGDEVCIVIS